MDIQKILSEHGVWIESLGGKGSSANLRSADLRGAKLPDHTFVIMGEEYFISITNGEWLRAGCQSHSMADWRKFSKHNIACMDSGRALNFYPRLLNIIDFYCGVGERPDWINDEE